MYSVMTKEYNGRYILEEDRQYNLCLFRQEEVQSVGFSHYEHIPAWSLHRLLLLLPTEYIADIDYQLIMQGFVFGSQYMYNEVINCIETLIETGYFYKEYLEE